MIRSKSGYNKLSTGEDRTHDEFPDDQQSGNNSITSTSFVATPNDNDDGASQSQPDVPGPSSDQLAEHSGELVHNINKSDTSGDPALSDDEEVYSYEDLVRYGIIEEEDSRTCAVCDRTFSSKRQLRYHKKRKRHYGCSVCEDVLSSHDELLYHKQNQDHWTYSDYESDSDQQDDADVEDDHTTDDDDDNMLESEQEEQIFFV